MDFCRGRPEIDRMERSVCPIPLAEVRDAGLGYCSISSMAARNWEIDGSPNAE